MKKFFVIALVVLSVAALSIVPAMAQGSTPTTPEASPVTVPTDLQVLFAAGIGFLVTQGLKSISNLANKDITGWGSVIAGALTTGVIAFANSLLTLIPSSMQQPAALVLMLIVSIFGAFGVHATIKGFQPSK